MDTLRKVWDLLDAAQRRAALGLFALMFVGMLFEMLGVGAVIPALAVMANRDLLAAYPAAAGLLQRLGSPSQEQLVTGGLLLLLAIYATKSVFVTLLTFRQAAVVADLQAGISQKLFDGYLRQPWTFHLGRNSAQLIRNAVHEAQLFASAASGALLILAEGLVLAGITLLLVAVEPAGSAMVVGALGVAAWVYQAVTRRLLKEWGAARQYHDGQRIQHLQQGLGAVKDVKLLGREAEFSARYREHNVGSVRYAERNRTLQQLPRIMFELLAVTCLVVLGLVIVGSGRSVARLLPTLGLFAAAAFRLLPSISRIMNSLSSIRFALPVIDTLHGELHILQSKPSAPRASGRHLTDRIELVDVTYRYEGAAQPALDGVSLRIGKGESIGLLGGSGAGKSTLVDVVLGLLTPTAGEVRVDGQDIQPRLGEWQNHVGYVPQSIYLIDDSLRRNIAFGIADAVIDEAAVLRALRAAQLERFVAELPDGLDTVVGERGVRLSGGQRQRIGIARALYHDPDVLVLDEATSALDGATEQGVMDAVSSLRGDKTILVVAHRLSTLAHCNRLYRLERGRVVAQGTYDEVCATGRDVAAAGTGT